MLTTVERAEFTTFNAIAFDLYRQEAQQKDEIPPCWLCMSGEAKQEYQEKAVAWLNANMRPIVPFSLDTAVKVVENQFGASLRAKVDLWMKAEEELKEAREAGNPRAFFVG